MAEQIGLAAVMDLSDFNRGVDRYLASINKMEQETDGLASSVFNSFQNLGAVVAGVGATLVATVGAAAALAAREFGNFVDQSIHDAMSLQEQLAEIGAVLGETLEEVGPLKDLIQELAIDPNLKVNTFEAADAIEQLAKNGLEVTTILDGAAKATIALANAAGGDFGQAADVVTDVLNIFGAQVGSASEAVNQITAVINKSKFNLNDYQLALSNAGAIAETVGISFEDLNAGLIAVSSAYNTGRRAGTGFSNAILNFVPKSKNAAELMAALGMVTEEGIIKFYDAEGAFLGLENAAEVLKESFGGLSEAERNFFIRQIFGIESQETIIRLMQLGAEGIAKIKTEMASVDAFKAAETRMKTLAGAVEVLDGIFEALRINFAYKSLPALEKGVRALNKVLETNFTGLQGMGDAFALLIEKVVDAAIPLIEEWVPKFIVGSQKLASWLVELIQTGQLFGAEFDKLPIPIQRIVTFMTNAWRAILKFVDQMKVFVDQVVLIIKPIWNWIAANVELEDVIIGLALGVLSLIAPLAIAIVKFGIFVTALFVGIHKIREAWEGDWGNIQGFTREVIERLLTMGETLVTILSTLFDRFGESGADGLERAFIAVQPIILGLLGVAQKVLDLLLLVVQGKWREAWAEIQQIAQDAIGKIPGILNQVWGYLKPILDQLVAYVIQKFDEIDWAAIWEQVKVYAKAAFDYLVDLFLSLDWAGMWEQVKKYAKLAFDYLVELFYSVDWAGLWELVKLYAKKAFDYLVDLFFSVDWAGLWEMVKGYAKDAWDYLVALYKSIDWKAIWGRIVTFLTPYLNWLKQKWEETWTWIEGKAGSTWGELIHNLRTGQWAAAWENIKDIAIDAWTTLSTFVLTHDWWSDIAKVLGEDFTYNTLKPLFDIIVGVTKALFVGAAEIIDWIGTWLSVEDTIVFITALIHEAVVAWILFHGTIVAKAALIALAFHILREAWETDWGGIREFTQGVWDKLQKIWSLGVELVKTIWGNFGVSLEDTAINAFKTIQDVVNFGLDLIITLLESGIMAANGDWEGAWNHLAEFLGPVWDRISEIVVNGLINIGNFIKNLDWAAIWQTVKDIAVFMWNGLWDFMEAITTEKWSAIIASARAGDWQPAWDEIKKIANEALDWIVDLVGGPDGTWGRLINNLREGDWKGTWDSIKEIFNLALDEIVALFGGETTGWGRLISDLRNGRWKEAWVEIKAIFNTAMDEIVKYLGGETTGWGRLITDLRNGDWKGVWTEIKAFANTAMDEIVKYFGGPETGWGKLITDLRAGEWSKVWSDIKGFANTAMDEIVKYLGGETTGWGRLVTDLRNADWKGAWAEIVALATPAWTVIKQWAIDRFVDILLFIQNTDWAAVWNNMVVEVTLIWETLRIWIPAKWDEIINYLETQGIVIPDWLKTGLPEAFAEVNKGATAYLQLLKDISTFLSVDMAENQGGGFIDMTVGFSHALEGLALWASQALLGMTRLRKFATGEDTSAEIAQMEENWKRLQVLGAEQLEGLGITWNKTSPESPLSQWVGGAEDALLRGNTAAKILSEQNNGIREALLDTEDILAFSGQASIEAFVKALGKGQPNAIREVDEFVQQIAMLAGGVQDGFLDAGASSTQMYIAGLISQHGLAEHEASKFAAGVMQAAESELLDLSVTELPTVITNAMLNPITEKAPEAEAAGTTLGKASITGAGKGVVSESPSFMEIFNGLYGEAVAKGQILETGAYTTGAESAIQLGAGVTASGPSAVDSYYAMVANAIATGAPLPTEYSRLGSMSMSELGSGVQLSQDQALVIMGEMVKQAMATGQPLPPEFFAIGQNSVEQLGLGAEGNTQKALDLYNNFIQSAIHTGTPLPPAWGLIGEGSVTELGSGVETNQDAALVILGEMVKQAMATGEPLPPEFFKLGGMAIEQLGTGADGNKDAAIAMYDNLVNAAIKTGTPLPPAFTIAGEEAATGLGTGAESKKQPTVDIFTGIKDATVAAMGGLTELMTIVGEAAINNLTKPFSEKAPVLVQQGLTLITGVIGVWSTEMAEKLATAGETLLVSLRDGMIVGAQTVVTFFAELRDNIEAWFVLLVAYFKEQGSEATLEMAEGLVAGGESVIQFFDGLREIIEDWFGTLIKYFNDRGIAAVAEFTAGLIVGTSVIPTGTIEIDKKLAEWAAIMIKWMNGRGIQAVAEMTAGLIVGVSAIPTGTAAIDAKLATWAGIMIEWMNGRGKQAIAEMVAGMITQAQATDVTPFKTLGENIGAALATGLGSQLETVKAKSAELVAAAATATAAAAQIASPSKLFQHLGALTGQGFLIGLGETMAQIPRLIAGAMDLVKMNNLVTGSSAQRIAPAVSPIPSYNTSNYATSVQNSFGPINVQDAFSEQVFINKVRRVVDDYVT